MIRQTSTDSDRPVTEQEWWCPQCGRRLLMSFPPAYRRVVLEIGDVWTPHAAGSGGVAVSPIEPESKTSQIWTNDDDRALQHWQGGLGDESSSD